jgi:thiamine transporter ThiT
VALLRTGSVYHVTRYSAIPCSTEMHVVLNQQCQKEFAVIVQQPVVELVSLNLPLVVRPMIVCVPLVIYSMDWGLLRTVYIGMVVGLMILQV